MTKLTRAEFVARAVADMNRAKQRGRREAWLSTRDHIEAERRKRRK
jgi:hypothetical protein